MNRYNHLIYHFFPAPACLIYKLPTVYHYVILLPVRVTNAELHSHCVVAAHRQIQGNDE